MLPFDDQEGEASDKVLDLALLDHEIKYMTENVTLELPENFFRRRLEPERGGRRIDSLQYVSFELRNTFPSNVALMKTGQIVYCLDFRTTDSGQVIIDGHAFLDVSIYLQ